MISEERKAWIQDNRARGDITKAVESLNKKGVPVKRGQANQILFNGIMGEFGTSVWNELEKVIRKRINQLKKEKELYASSK